MKLILKNNSDDTFSYTSASVTVSPQSNLEVSSTVWFSLYADFNFQKDLGLQNIIVSDGIQDYDSKDGKAYIEKLLSLSIANRDSSGAQITTVTSQPPYGAKTLIINGVVKKLYARFTGQEYSVVQGDNELTYTATYPWTKIVGIEVIGCENLDKASLKVYDTAQGTYSGVPNLLLNQFSYELNLSKDFYVRMAQFDADLYQGMVIKITYNSKSAKSVGINFLINEVK